MTKKFYPRWIENKPKKNKSICYLLAGYGCIFIGESGSPSHRYRSTLRDKKWAAFFLWINLHQFGILDTKNRKHLEASMIFSAANTKKYLRSVFSLENRQYTYTLGRFHDKDFYQVKLIDALLSNFMNYVRSNDDRSISYLTDVATWQNEGETDEARMAAFLRINAKHSGRDPVGQSVRYLELRLSPYREE